jgi:hypothetical protein
VPILPLILPKRRFGKSDHVFVALPAFALGVVTGGAIALVVFAPKRTTSTPEPPDEGADGGSDHVEITAGAGLPFTL